MSLSNDPMYVDYDPKSGNMPVISKEQFSRLASDLEDKHALFYVMWQLGHIRFTDALPTAAIAFNREGDSIDFLFNPTFWNNSDQTTRQFIICHECLHVALKHGLRMKDTINPEIVNTALDIVVNHLIVNRFGFDRTKVQNWRKYCWVDTIFQGQNIPDNKSAEYYIGLLKKMCKQITAVTVDDHSLLSDSMGDGQGQGQGRDSKDGKQGQQKKETNNSNQGKKEDKGDKMLKRMDGLLSPEEKKRLRDLLTNGSYRRKDNGQDDDGKDDKDKKDGDKTEGGDPSGVPFAKAGKGVGGCIWTFPDENVRAKKKWTTLVKKWALRNKHVWADSEQWVRMNRRNVLLDKALIIPSDMEMDDGTDKQKINAWIFLDTSGSCVSFRERFWKLVRSIPRKFFTLKLHTFDTRVYEIKEDAKGNAELRGGGGTSFNCIEEYIQAEMKKQKVKCHITAVVTDGCGDNVHPEFPEKWCWIMPHGSCEDYCHPDSQIVAIEDFE